MNTIDILYIYYILTLCICRRQSNLNGMHRKIPQIEKNIGFHLKKQRQSFTTKTQGLLTQDHSENEERFIILGFSYKLNLLMVSHCYRSSKDTIRIFSARKATKLESKQYEEFL